MPSKATSLANAGQQKTRHRMVRQDSARQDTARQDKSAGGRWTTSKGLISIAVLALGLTACGSSGNSASNATQASPTTAPSPVSTGGAAASVTQAWETFFSGSSTAQQKIDHLQNGQQFSQLIQAQANSPLAKSASAKVTDVAVNGASAAVTYSVLFNGSPVLQNQKGQALLENGVWKVSDASFCQLLALENSVGASSAPSGAPSAGSGALPPACAGAMSGAPGGSAGASAST